MELILKITWTWYGGKPFLVTPKFVSFGRVKQVCLCTHLIQILALSRTNVIGVIQQIIRLESYAFLCFDLPFPSRKNTKTEKKM